MNDRTLGQTVLGNSEKLQGAMDDTNVHYTDLGNPEIMSP